MSVRALSRAAILLLAALACTAEAQTLGRCRFDIRTRSFDGDAAAQASCLMRTVGPLGSVAARPAQLPPNLASLIGRPLPFKKSSLAALIVRQGSTPAMLGGNLDAPLTRGGDNLAFAPPARYFVIHDTSTPNFGAAPFPADINSSPRVNALSRYHGAQPVAHIFVNRLGETWTGHNFDVPWRATKIERSIGFPSKGLFLHVELIQPRRVHPAQADGTAPMPGFTTAQYDSLALLYLVASTRAGTGLIPAFHAALDEGLWDGHDDPQNFDLAAFDTAVGRALEAIE